MIDFIKTAINRFIAEGMSPLEVIEEFDSEQWKQALMEDIDLHGYRNSELLDFAASATKERMDLKDLDQATELWLAGWTSEEPSKGCRLMSLYWRAPAKGSRKLGRRYLSTNQAFNALKRQLTN